MTNQEHQSSEVITYDFREMETCEGVGCISNAIREAIKPLLEAIIVDCERFTEVYHGVGEVIKDVEVHGDESKPRLITVKRELGGLAIHTINTIKQDSHVNGFGAAYKELAFGDNHSTVVDGDTFESHTFIPSDNALWQSAKIRQIA